jgi:hypothetical protein
VGSNPTSHPWVLRVFPSGGRKKTRCYKLWIKSKKLLYYRQRENKMIVTILLTALIAFLGVIGIIQAIGDWHLPSIEGPGFLWIVIPIFAIVILYLIWS